ncbi:MAG: urea ABC transporter permease subunit UrtB [Desulfovibrionaceae bacterium]
MSFACNPPSASARLAACALTALLFVLAASAQAQAFTDADMQRLTSRSLSDRDQAVDALAQDDSDLSTALLRALLDGDLYYVKKTKKVVIAKLEGKRYNIFDPESMKLLGDVNKRAVAKLSTNNSIRQKIRGVLDMRELSSPHAEIRRKAAAGMVSKLGQIDPSVLQDRLAKETDSEVREHLQVALAVSTLETASGDEALKAVRLLKGNMNPEVLQVLTDLKERAQDPQLKKAINVAIQGIKAKAKIYGVFETIFFGAGLGAVLVLAAIGLAITFGVMGVINMAHGELIMLGAYTTYVIQQLMPQHIGASLFVAVPAAFLAAGAMGVVIERTVIRLLYGRPLETLLATFGVSLILQQAVRSIFSPLNRSVSTPEWMSGSLEINPIFSLTLNRLYIILFCLIVFAALFLLLKKTRLGLEVRAVSQNREMARAMGTKASMVDALTFGLGSGIAGIAGVALSQLTNVGPNLGQSYIIDSFMVVVFGGVGNLWGTLVAGLSLGVINKLLEPVSGAVLAKILILVFIILFIQKRPTGLFPQKGRAVED